MDRATHVLVLTLAGCGRLGFPGAGDGAGDGPITVVVLGDETATAPAGRPIANATVLIDRGATLERTASDASGTVQFSSAGVAAFHVVHHSDQRWRIYTVALPGAAAIELGGRSLPSLVNRTMTLVLPSGGNNDSFAAAIPDRCATDLSSRTSTWQLTFDASCDNTSVSLIAFRFPSGAPYTYIDAGNVMLAGGSTYTVTGSYLATPAQTIQISHLPVATTSVSATIIKRVGVNFTPLLFGYDRSTFGGGSATFMAKVVPGGNAMRVETSHEIFITPGRILSERIAIEPLVAGPSMSFDAAVMLSPFSELTLDRLPVLSWTGGGTAGTITVVEAVAADVQWTAYADTAATAVRFPDLPADLNATMPTAFDAVTLTKLDVPGTATADLARAIDRTWQRWPSDASLLPSAGGSIARVVYTAQ